MFSRYKNLENFQNIWGAVLLFIIKKRYHFQMNWFQLETWSDITLECDITLATLSDITLKLSDAILVGVLWYHLEIKYLSHWNKVIYLSYIT